MDKGFLEQRLEQGMSFAEIGREIGRDPSTVSYWAKKHGLRACAQHARHTPRGALSKARLTALVSEGLVVREIAERVGRSERTVRYWIDRHGLQQPIKHRRSDVDAAQAAGLRSVVRDCAVHGRTRFVIENSGRARCARCRQQRVADWRRRTKALLVEEAGGQCAMCGYDRYAGALQFHHLDPGQKEFGLSVRGVARSIEKLRAEAAKCVLLCANCHAEVEGDISRVPLE